MTGTAITRAAPLLQVRDLRVAFHLHGARIEAVKGVSFDLPAGKTVALVGESGSGKSVIAQSIMGILPKVGLIEGGEILFRDPDKPDTAPVNLASLAPMSPVFRAIRGGRIGMIFQEPMTSLSPLHVVGDQIAEAVRLHKGTSRKDARDAAQRILGHVGFPDPARALGAYPFELSGGLRQRAMIAMALVCRPALLIADEPTTALDVTIQAQILKLIRDLQAEFSMAVLMITHDLGVVANLADEIVVLYHGQAMESGSAADLFRDPRHPYLKALMRAVPRLHRAENERLTPLREITVDFKAAYLVRGNPAQAAAKADPILEVIGLGKSYAVRSHGLFAPKATPLRAVDDVSFSLARGQCLGLVGESGCGKTTTSKIILRALDADEGQVWFHDGDKRIDVLSLGGADLFAYRRKAQFVFQDPFASLNPRMTVLDLVAEPLLIHGIGDQDERYARVEALMRLVGLDPRFMRRYPHSFSGGQRQRIGIARALALGPDLLVCDEPVSALDVSIQAQILNLLKDLQSEMGLSYLFISHNLAVVDYIAQDIAVMCAGRIVERAPRAALFRDPVHPYTRALLSAVPEPSLDAKLDLGALMEGRASIPSAWPAPFTIDTTRRPSLIDIGGGHFVRADESLLGARRSA